MKEACAYVHAEESRWIVMLEKPYIENLALAIPKSNNYYTTEK